MGVDVNDVKILINAGFRYLIKTCHQWAKDHPLVTSVLLFFYLLYIFFPYLFNVLFYTFPLIICVAIILGGKHISSKQKQELNKNNKKYDILRTMSVDHRRRPRFNSHMRSRTTLLGKTEEYSQEDNYKDYIENLPINNNTKITNQNEISTRKIGDFNSTTSSCMVSEKTSPTNASNHTSAGISSHSDTDEDDNDHDLTAASRNKVVQWTEDDQRNLMDLGTSEIERNKRLESLIAKRRARKQLSMQPIRLPHYPYENLMDQVGSIMVSRCIDHDADHQPGSAPCILRPVRNPFDLPYDPHEEKPILTGGSFDDEFFSNEQKELILGENLSKNNENNVGDGMEAFDVKSLPSFFMPKPKPVEKPGFTRFRRESEENMQDMLDEFSKEEAREDQAPNKQDSHKKDQMSTILTLPKEEEHELVNPFATNFDPPKSDLVTSSERVTKDETITKERNEQNTFDKDKDSEAIPEVQPKIQDQDDDDDDDETTSSSSSSSIETINAIKNEAFRHSVKKVLNCLVIQRNRTNRIPHNTSNGLPYNSIPHITTPSKMEERSYYTNRPHHTSTFSIASDMQVEVSETGSPPLTTADPSSPTDRESLVYDGDVDKDVNSGDEDLWGASPHPTKLGEFGAKKLPDITEEGSDNVKGLDFRDMYNNDIDPIEERRDERTSKGDDNDQDQRSVDAEIAGSRSSVSSSSDGLMSQTMQTKSEHLAEFLANLPPAEIGSNASEEPEWEPSHVREPSSDDRTVFELDEGNDETRNDEEVDESHEGSSDQSVIATETRQTKETTPNLENQLIEGEASLEENEAIETEPYVKEATGHKKKLISDSSSTTCHEDILEQSRFVEGHHGLNLQGVGITNDGDQVGDTSNDFLNNDKSTLVEKLEDDQITHTILDEKKPELSIPNIQSEVNFREVDEDSPQPATIEENNMELSSSIDVASSRPMDDTKDDHTDHLNT